MWGEGEGRWEEERGPSCAASKTCPEGRHGDLGGGGAGLGCRTVAEGTGTESAGSGRGC